MLATLMWHWYDKKTLQELFQFYQVFFILFCSCNVKCEKEHWIRESLVSLVTIVFLLSCFCWDAQNVFFKSSLAAFYHLTMLTVPISPKRNAVDQVLWKHFEYVKKKILQQIIIFLSDRWPRILTPIFSVNFSLCLPLSLIQFLTNKWFWEV